MGDKEANAEWHWDACEAIGQVKLRERERIVNWLREFGDHGTSGEASCPRCQIANAIEAAEHWEPR